MGHRGFVLAVRFGPDGRRLYSASTEGAVRVWDAREATLLQVWRAHGAAVRDLALSTDGRRLWSASKDGTVGVRDTTSGASLGALRADGGGAFCVVAEDDRVAAGAFDGAVRVWRGEGGEVQVLRGHAEPVTGVGFLRDGRLVSASRDRSVKVWDVAERRCLHTFTGHARWVTRLRVLPDGRRVVTVGEDGTVRLWDCAQGRALWARALPQAPPVWGLAVDAAGTRALTGAAGRTDVWDLARGERTGALPVRAFAHRAIAIAPDDRTLALGGDDSHILLLDGPDGRARRLPGASALVQCAVASPDGSRVASGHADGSLTLHEDRERRRLPRAHDAFVYAASPVDAEHYATGGFDGAVRVWPFGARAPVERLAHGGPVFSVAASADGRHLFAAGGARWALWDRAAGSAIARVVDIGTGSHTVGDLAPDGTFVVSAGEDALLRVWSAAGSPLATHPLPRPVACALRVVPGGREVLVADAGGWLQRVDLRTGACEPLHAHHEDWIRSLQGTPDGRTVLSVSQENDCVLYDAVEGRVVTPAALRRPIAAAHLLPSGAVVAVTPEGEVLRG